MTSQQTAEFIFSVPEDAESTDDAIREDAIREKWDHIQDVIVKALVAAGLGDVSMVAE